MMTENLKKAVDVERTKQLRKARKALTAFVILVAMPLCCFLLSSIRAEDETLVITPSPTITPTRTPELVTVEYQLEVGSEVPAASVEFWYTSGAGGQNQTESQRINNTRPFTETVMIYPGEHIEISGVLVNGIVGELTCRILVDGVLIEQSTSRGAGAGVHCSGAALIRPSDACPFCQ